MLECRVILKDIGRINPAFYPEPVVEAPGSQPGVKADLQPLKKGFLTQAEFIKLYKKCGAIMHCGNPYGSQIDYGYYKGKIPYWRTQILNLLDVHKITLVDHAFYLVHMNEADGHVHHYSFVRVDG